MASGSSRQDPAGGGDSRTPPVPPQIVILPIRTTPLADLQILELDSWWREHRDKAPDLFEQELAVAFRTIGIAPLAGKRSPHPEIDGVRRLLMRATRNHVYYVVQQDYVLVLAVWGAIKGAGPELSVISVDD